MNSRFLLGRALHKDNMRIVRRVAASFFKFFFAFLRELGALVPPFIVFILIFTLGMAYADYTFVKSFSEHTGCGSELNNLATFLNEELKKCH